MRIMIKGVAIEDDGTYREVLVYLDHDEVRTHRDTGERKVYGAHDAWTAVLPPLDSVGVDAPGTSEEK